MQVAANAPWFTFSTGTLLSNFEVYSFTGTEAVSTSYEFIIELVSKSAKVNLLDYMGKPASLTIADRSGGKRVVHGIIREMEQLHTANVFTHYRCYLVPRLWFLTQHCDHHIYQHLSVVDIISDVLQRQGFTDECFEFKCFTKYEPREYCVQYGESDFHFINRLCEEEGIYYYFEHSASAHKLCFCDMPGGPRIPGNSNLRYFQGSGEQADTAVISRLQFHQKVNSDAASFREWNFAYPGLDLVAEDYLPADTEPLKPAGTNLESYRFPHLYNNTADGNRYVRIQLKRQLTWESWITGESDVSHLIPACEFTLYAHPRSQLNTNWWLVSVIHKGEQPQSLEHEAPEKGMYYKCVFKAIPHQVQFVPAIRHPKKRIDGLQSAIVTGPGDEEVYTDKFGRVKVQFHWDRLGNRDENTTCWVRVADTWAGDNFGFIQVPRIGQEVLVEYMEGDPDRPVITGRVYNGSRMTPWTLPEQKTLSGIQSKEFKGRQRNQLVLDDTEGQVQAQLSSDHNLSQLNLGYLTRINHQTGRDDFRGEGFELRTDGWGVIRSGKGMVISTSERVKANNHQKDIAETSSLLQDGEKLHNEATRLSIIHKTIDETEDANPLKESLQQQNSSIAGSGEAHSELAKPHLVLSSPVGTALSTPESIHIQTGDHIIATSTGHNSTVTGKNILATAFGAIRLFAHRLGVRLFAGEGKVEIQAQTNDIDIIAQQVLRLISTQASIELTAAKSITLIADNSYLRITGAGIEHGTNGEFVAKASSHSFEGPGSESAVLPDLPKSSIKFNDEYVVIDQVTEKPIDKMKYEILYPNGSKTSGTTGKDGKIPLQESLTPDAIRIRLFGTGK